jgi:hypothetical protein
MLVCGNTADMLAGTRYAPHFRVTGDKRDALRALRLRARRRGGERGERRRLLLRTG